MFIKKTEKKPCSEEEWAHLMKIFGPMIPRIPKVVDLEEFRRKKQGMEKE